MSEIENPQTPQEETASAAPPAAEAPQATPPAAENPPASKPAGGRPGNEGNREARGQQRPPRGDRPDRGPKPQGGDRGGERSAGGDRGGERGGGDRRREGGRPNREGGPRGGSGRPDLPADIDLDKLITDSLYLDNQAHAVVSRMRDMDSGTRSQLRRLYSAVRRACRAAEADRQHQFVMLRARLAYTIARYQLRSLDTLERLLLQVTRKNEARGYERFRDLFEAIVAYNE